MERLKNFSFDEWRIRYMNWHKDNRTRITDFFRRRDRDHDGKISREEFIQNILDSSKFFSLFFNNIYNEFNWDYNFKFYFSLKKPKEYRIKRSKLLLLF